MKTSDREWEDESAAKEDIAIYRQRSVYANRRQRIMSADVVALPSSDVCRLRSLYTAKSEFANDSKEIKVPNTCAVDRRLCESIAPLTPPPPPPPPRQQIEPKALFEIEAFEKLIEDYFRRKKFI